MFSLVQLFSLVCKMAFEGKFICSAFMDFAFSRNLHQNDMHVRVLLNIASLHFVLEFQIYSILKEGISYSSLQETVNTS